VFKGEQFAPKFRALNPLGKVPVLEDPRLDRPLAESGAILLWLAEREGRLLPSPSAPSERAETIQWLMIQMASIGPMFGQLNHFRILPEGSEPYALARYRAQARTLYRLLDERLENREWLAGGAYSLADIATFPWACYLERHEFAADEYPALIAWRDRIAARPAVIAAQQRVAQEWGGQSIVARREATGDDLDRFFGRSEDVPPADYSSVLQG